MVSLLWPLRVPPEKHTIVTVYGIQGLNAMCQSESTATFNLQVAANYVQTSCDNLGIVEVGFAFSPSVASAYLSKPDDPFVQLSCEILQLSHRSVRVMVSEKTVEYQ